MFQRSFPAAFEAAKAIRCFPPELENFQADVLEIGPGNGEWLLSMCAAQPEREFAAVELRESRYLKLTAQIRRAGLSNILLIQGNARVMIPRCFEEETFQEIYVLFPEPWPKRRHAFRRLLDRDFLEQLARRLRKGGKLVIATDVPAYADWVEKNAGQSPLLEKAQIPNREGEPPAVISTFFEKKWRNQGRSIHSLCYRRQRAARPGHPLLADPEGKRVHSNLVRG